MTNSNLECMHEDLVFRVLGGAGPTQVVLDTCYMQQQK